MNSFEMVAVLQRPNESLHYYLNFLLVHERHLRVSFSEKKCTLYRNRLPKRVTVVDEYVISLNREPQYNMG
jgi:hypothetical protein